MAEDPASTTPVPEGDGVVELRSRVERRSRAVPKPRRARAEPADKAVGEGLGSSADAAKQPATVVEPLAAPDTPIPPPARGSTGSEPDAPQRPPTRPNEPTANLVVRVRRSVDDRLVELLHAFRQEGVRTSKVELVELLIWELPEKPTAELRDRLSTFRRKAPREAPL